VVFPRRRSTTCLEGEGRGVREDRLLEPVMDHDEAHGTLTLCSVWPTQKRTLARVR
jgi:hypothetical protein